MSARLSEPPVSLATVCSGTLPSESVSSAQGTFFPEILRSWVLGLIALASSVYSPVFAQSTPQESPEQLLESMAVALKTLNYEGVFVHAQGTSLTSIHIVRAREINGNYELLISLDGEAREVYVNNSLVTCIWPESEAVVVSKSEPLDLLPQIDTVLINSKRYEFSHGKNDRVAGRKTYVIDVRPRDKYRYGFRFWIDSRNSMLLRSMLLDGPDKPVEQVIFTDIEFPEKIDLARFDFLNADIPSGNASWLEAKSEQARVDLETSENALHRASGASEQVSLVSDGVSGDTPDDNKADEELASNVVSFISLPAGYQKISETVSSMPSENGPVRHVVLTDGMASVSVYIERIAENQSGSNGATLGLSRMGAMNAYAVTMGKSLVTAVGDVPHAAVMAIAAAVVVAE